MVCVFVHNERAKALARDAVAQSIAHVHLHYIK